jgi:hypothetical protein
MEQFVWPSADCVTVCEEMRSGHLAQQSDRGPRMAQLFGKCSVFVPSVPCPCGNHDSTPRNAPTQLIRNDVLYISICILELRAQLPYDYYAFIFPWNVNSIKYLNHSLYGVGRNMGSSGTHCDNSVGIALGYGLDDRCSRVRFPAGAGNFSLHHRFQNGSGAHLAYYPMGTRWSFSGAKAAGAWS